MTEPKYSWKMRRRFMFIVSAFSMIVILVSLIFRAETAVAPTAISFGFGTLTGIVGSYVFGSVWEDKNRKDG